jgi:hypothetical protein
MNDGKPLKVIGGDITCPPSGEFQHTRPGVVLVSMEAVHTTGLRLAASPALPVAAGVLLIPL